MMQVHQMYGENHKILLGNGAHSISSGIQIGKLDLISASLTAWADSS